MILKIIEYLDTSGRVLDNTTSAIITKQREIINMLNEVIERLVKDSTSK